jgi:hypothetical protein
MYSGAIGNVPPYARPAGTANGQSQPVTPGASLAPGERPAEGFVGMFLNADGDRAEISGNAMNLYQDMANGFQTPASSQGMPFSGSPSPGTVAAGAPKPTGQTTNSGLGELQPAGTCDTCASRKYVDKSDDPSVSFQTPTNISAAMSGVVVASHEREHVNNERSRARREDRQVIQQSVSLTYDTCPECGRRYVSGGVTRTTTIGKSESNDNMPTDEENDAFSPSGNAESAK